MGKERKGEKPRKPREAPKEGPLSLYPLTFTEAVRGLLGQPIQGGKDERPDESGRSGSPEPSADKPEDRDR